MTFAPSKRKPSDHSHVEVVLGTSSDQLPIDLEPNLAKMLRPTLHATEAKQRHAVLRAVLVRERTRAQRSALNANAQPTRLTTVN